MISLLENHGDFFNFDLTFSFTEAREKSYRRYTTVGYNMQEMSGRVASTNITPGGIITKSGNSEHFRTGDWRSSKPVFLEDKCKQCLLCCPMCPDSSIPVDENGKRLDFDYDHCKGCGICANVCPFDAIEMSSDL